MALRNLLEKSSLGTVNPAPAPTPVKGTQDANSYNYSDIMAELNSGTDAENNMNKWKAAVHLADMDGSAKTDAELRALQDDYFARLEPTNDLTGEDMRGDGGFIMKAADAVGNTLDSLYLAGGNLLDSVLLDGLAAGAAEFATGDKSAGDWWRNLTTGEDLAIIPELASDVALAAVPGVGWGVLAAKGAIDSRDELYSGITGKDRNTGEELGDMNQYLNLGAGLASTILPGVMGKGATKAAAKGFANEANKATKAARGSAEKAANELEKGYTKFGNAENAYDEALLKNGPEEYGYLTDDVFKKAQDIFGKQRAGEQLTKDEAAWLKMNQKSLDAADAENRINKVKNATQSFDQAADAHLKRIMQQEEAQGALDQALKNVAAIGKVDTNAALPNLGLMRMAMDRTGGNIAARAAAAGEAGGPIKGMRAFLKNPNAKEAVEEAAEETGKEAAKKGGKEAAKKGSEKASEEVLPEDALLEAMSNTKGASFGDSVKSLRERLFPKKSEDFTGMGNIAGLAANAGIGGLNLAAASGGNNLPEIMAGMKENWDSMSTFDKAMMSAALMKPRSNRAVARRFAGNQNPYWTRRMNATAAATEDPLGARALPATADNSAIMEELLKYYLNEEESQGR